ncbi:MAG: prepilin peptidase [Lachnospiraceae bacterium]|nr:prepilin peptidase [Lachnospiraceae bacterium]
MNPEIIFYIIVFVYGITIGSFVNVCIYRIPKKENIVNVRSHCMQCGYQLKWYDLVPLFSYVFLGGKCRKCKTKISIQYPIIEAVNGILYMLVFFVSGWNAVSILYCLFASALLTLSIIDFRTYEIPFGINLFILTLGLIHVAMDFDHWLQYAIGLMSVSIFLYVIYIATKGRGIGGGDVKLMAACGLLLGWKLNLVGFLLGCILGSILHLIRMKVTKASHVLAMGPYLSLGVLLAALWGDRIINWYLAYLL